MSIDIKDTGELKAKPAFSLLYQALCDSFDGVLVFARGKEKYSVVTQGQKLKTPIAILNEATLGKYMFDQKVLDDESFMQVKKKQGEKNIPFFQAAIESGLVSFDQIQNFVHLRMAEIIACVFSWDDGKYVVVEQVPKDTVQIEVSETLFVYLFLQRIKFYQKNKAHVLDKPIAFAEHANLSIENIPLAPMQTKILQALKKTKTVGTIAQFLSVDENEVHGFIHTLLDFQLLAYEKEAAKITKDKKYFVDFDFRFVYDNYEELSFYELLAVPVMVSPAEVSSQYFEIAKHYHPDRYKQSEDFAKEKVERVFGRITEAYQTLSNASLKSSYDDKISGKGKEDQLNVEKVLESENRFLDGMDFLRRGQFEKARSSFKEAVALYSEEYEYFIRLGWAEYRLGLKTNAPDLVAAGKTAIAKALKQDRIKDDVLYYQGLIFKNDEAFEKAKMAFQKCLSENKNHLQAGQELRAVSMLLEKRGANKKGWFK